MSGFVLGSENGTSSFGQANWTGIWDSELFQYQFIQNGNNIIGIFRSNLPGSADAGWINGIVSEDEKTFTGFWSQVGPVLLTKENDTNFLSGSWGYYTNATNGGTFTFTGEDTDGWSGTWISDSHIFHLTRNDSRVSGTFEVIGKIPNPNGPVKGTLNDDETRFLGTWNETGAILFTLSEDLNSFNGSYGYNPEHLDAGNWYGFRVE